MPSTATDRLNGLTTSVAIKPPVKAVTSGNITLSGLQTIGGVALAEDDRVLVKDQTDTTDNGIYLASTSDWTRAKDFDGNRDAVKGTLVVTDGVSTALLFYRLTTADPVLIGTSAITFVQASEIQNPYPRTPAEIAAGVTPVDYAYVAGVLDRYATNTTPGTTDMTAAWTAADAQSAQGGAPIYVRRVSGGYAFASAISVDYRSEVDKDVGAYITYTGSSNLAFMTIGSAANVAQFGTFNLPEIRRSSQSDWTNEANIGLKIFNCSDCWIWIPRVNGFTINCQIIPTGANAFAQNHVFLGMLYNGKVQLDLSNATSGACNENNFYGGRFTMASNPNSSLAAYGIRITSSDGAYVSNNNNNFFKPTFELGASLASSERIPILMTHGVQNHFYACRDEDNDAPFAREANASSENTYEVGYSDSTGYPSIESSSTSPLYKLISARTRAYDSPNRVVFSSGPMHKLACYYDGGTNIHVPNVSIARASDATIYTNHANVTLNAAYVEFTASGSGPAIFIDTSQVKQFLVTKDCEASFGGRVVVNCYDAGGSIITTASSVLGTLAAPFSSTADYGGAFITGSDSADNAFFTVATAVKSIRIALVESTANLRIRSFCIYGVNTHQHAASWTGYEQVVPGASIGTAAPTAGTWARGKTVYNANPSSGNPQGWICTVAGTPGTWVAMANLA